MHPLKSHEIPGHVHIVPGRGGLPSIRVETPSSTAVIYPHGAHVTCFQKHGEPPLLFLSDESDFEAGKPIRGGVPVIFPWFGPRDGLPAHGTARIVAWDLLETKAAADGSVILRLRLPTEEDCEVGFTVTVGQSLTLQMDVTNTGPRDFTFENCLHTYFQTGAIHGIGISGLQGVRYLDKVAAGEFTEAEETLRIAAEVDRVYQDTAATVEITDPELRRLIRVRKSGSLSTVVWNPWIEKSKRMPDFGDDEYLHMLCVESGNVGKNAITLAPGARASMNVELSSEPL